MRNGKHEPSLTQAEVEALLGDARELAERFERHDRSLEQLLLKQPELTRTFPDRWIAWLDGDLVGEAATLSELVCDLDRRGVPRRDRIVRFMAVNPPRMIV